MNGRFLLDTNIVIALFKNDNLVKDKISEAAEIFLSNVTIGELYFGAYKSNRVEDNIRQLEDFIFNNNVLNCDQFTAKFYGQIKNQLKFKGKPIPENDIWIAAIAIQHNLVLISRDKHLREIEGLFLKKW